MFLFRSVSVAVFLAAIILPRSALAVSQSVVINELQTGTSASASQEFVELYNQGSDQVDLSGWSLQYRAASATGSWFKKASLTGAISPGGFYLLATNSYLQPDQVMSSGLAATGGIVRLVDDSGTVVDMIGWGSAAQSESAPAAAPPSNQSLERITADDTDNNSADFAVNQYPDPTASDGVSQGSPSPDPTDGSSQTTDTATVNITELLINPVGSDATDEFIELHNSSDVSADIGNDKLQSGSGFKDSYTLPAGTIIAPGQYLAFYSRQTHLSLTNTGGAARLVDPADNLIDQTADYDTASQGQAWALFADGWQWTADLTPGGANVLILPPPPSTDPVSAPVSKTSKATTKTAKVSAAKTSKPKVSGKSAKTKATKTQPVQALLADASSSPQSRWLLLAALALTIGYAIYEFRFDLRNHYVLTKRKLGAGRKNRPAA